ncbi:NitT/TauT family transport system permease protein [Pseudonocardia thermophila]|uniref:NitT/TauT family transport system permease protein n=1 Tax=Pseudonocardia thermophila TaxID=1848 RepID=A0A1M6UEX0_PSETH|nr:ABC transporter permease [Pseudonocardia thermophila]SHK67719.1 NitT/TauT family transport system permease protein [Pseudonocardia thermophila]
MTAVPAAAPVVPDEVGVAIDAELRAELRRRRRDVVLAAATPMALLALWEIGARTGAIDPLLFSPPSAILARGVELTLSGELILHLLATVARLVVGFVAGAVAGIAVGLLMSAIRPVRAALDLTFTALYALPKIAILPLLLLIFGITETPKVLAVAIAVFFVLQINTLAGYKQIDPRVLEAARAYGATGWKGFRYVVLPAAMPAVFTGLRVSAGMSVVVVTAVEFVASESGLGYLIWNSWQLFQPERMYVGLIVVSALGAALTGLLLGLERLLLPWRRSTPGRRRMRKGVR